MVYCPHRACVSLVVVVGVLSLAAGVIENFAYKRLREVGATPDVLGKARLISSIAGKHHCTRHFTRYKGFCFAAPYHRVADVLGKARLISSIAGKHHYTQSVHYI